MKGYFSLAHDPYTAELAYGLEVCDAKILVHDIRDALRSGSRIGMLVAHDTIEHALSHRTKNYVTFEEELRAIGALEFVRSGEYDNWDEVYNQCDQAQFYRDIKPVPEMVAKGLRDSYALEVELIKTLIQKGITPTNARNAAYHYAWGHEQKSYQFGGYQWRARNAFTLIESNVECAIQAISDHESWGASCYFDSEKHMFRYQMKWRY